MIFLWKKKNIAAGFIYQNSCNRDVFPQNKKVIWRWGFLLPFNDLFCAMCEKRTPVFTVVQVIPAPMCCLFSQALFHFVAAFSEAWNAAWMRCPTGCRGQWPLLYGPRDAAEHWHCGRLFYVKQRTATLEERTRCADQCGRRLGSLGRVAKVFWRLKWGF